MDWKRIACAGGGLLAVVAIALIIVSSVFASTARSNNIQSSGPISIDEHDEKSLVKIDASGTSTVLIIFLVVLVVIIIVAAACCFHRQVYLPKRRQDREQQRVMQEQLHSHNDQVASIYRHVYPSPAVPGMQMASMPARASSVPAPTTAGGRDYFPSAPSARSPTTTGGRDFFR